jgi:hypothetical protein
VYFVYKFLYKVVPLHELCELCELYDVQYILYTDLYMKYVYKHVLDALRGRSP